MIPLKLVKLATNYLAGFLLQSINNSIKEGLFPKNAKVVSDIPVDKKSDDKNSVINFRSIKENILKTKFPENVQSILPFIFAQ